MLIVPIGLKFYSRTIGNIQPKNFRVLIFQSVRGQIMLAKAHQLFLYYNDTFNMNDKNFGWEIT